MATIFGLALAIGGWEVAKSAWRWATRPEACESIGGVLIWDELVVLCGRLGSFLGFGEAE